jgi:N-acetylmuramoyl-L-alanine amidase
MLICIDPGHSGPYEPGSCAGHFTEADLNLSISLLIGDLLAARGHDVIYTREGNLQDDGLAFRAAIANEAGANIFVSIHCNAATSAAAGVETWYHPESPSGKRLASLIQGELVKAGYTINRGIKASAELAVLKLTNMPTVLVECGFITSALDRRTIASPQGQVLIAAAIVLGIETATV